MESKRLESRKTLRSGADKLAGTMISNFKNTLELTQRRELEEPETTRIATDRCRTLPV